LFLVRDFNIATEAVLYLQEIQGMHRTVDVYETDH